MKPRPSPEKQPPRGVPRWLWPPPGATVRTVVLVETLVPGGEPQYAVAEGDPLEALHLRALPWLLDEHPRGSLPPPGTPFEGRVRLDIARTEMSSGRVGPAYAINGGPLGAPGEDGTRGILWRYIEDLLPR